MRLTLLSTLTTGLLSLATCHRHLRYNFEVENTYKSQLVLEDYDVPMPMAYDPANEQVVRILPVNSVKACPEQAYTNYNHLQMFDKCLKPIKDTLLGPAECSINALSVFTRHKRKDVAADVEDEKGYFSSCTSTPTCSSSTPSCSSSSSTSSCWPTDYPTVSSSCSSSSSWTCSTETPSCSTETPSCSTETPSCSTETPSCSSSSTSTCTTSSTWTCSSESCRTSGDPFPCSEEHEDSCSCENRSVLTTGCPGNVNRIGSPCLDRKCAFNMAPESEGYVSVQTDRHGRTYILFEDRMLIMDKRCDIINEIIFESFDPKATTPDAKKADDITNATAMLLDQQHGYLIIFFTDSKASIYNMTTLSFLDCGFVLGEYKSGTFTVQPSALRGASSSDFWFYMLYEDKVYSARYSYSTGEFHSQCLSNLLDDSKAAAVPADAGEADNEKAVDYYPCRPVSEGGNLVFQDWKNHTDILVGQSPYGRKLHFMTVHYRNGAYKTRCSHLRIPENITGRLATFDAAQHRDHLYMSFAPSASMIEVKYSVKSH